MSNGTYGYVPLSRSEDDDLGMQAMVRQVSMGKPPQDVVQFIESVAVVSSDEGQLDVGVMRIGLCEGTCKCTWRTEEGSAVDGKQFVHSSGVIEMKHGENSANVVVPILCDTHWNATKEFRILIEHPENCTLGLYLKTVRVKVIDANVFPSNSFRSQVNPIADDISEFGLFIDYLKLMWHQDGVPWRTVVSVFIIFLKLLYEYVSLICSVYMVDKVFNDKFDEQDLVIPGERVFTAYAVALVLFLPELFFFFLHHLENQMDLDGRMRSEMSKSLFRKFMNYSSKSRDEVPLPDMVGSLTQDASKVAHGYKRVLHMLRCAGQIAIAIFFTLQQNPGAWWAVVAVPCIMAFWIKVRVRPFIEASERNDEKESGLLAFSNMALSKMAVIGAYRQRPQMNDLFAEKVTDLVDDTILMNKVNINNTSVPEKMGPTLVAVYTICGAALVLNGELKLGTYLATIKVFGSICGNFSEMFHVAMSIISTFPTLKGLTDLLNLETELPAMKKAAKETAEITKKMRAEMPAEPKEIPRVDRMKIEMRNVAFSYEVTVDNKPYALEIFRDMTLSARQGQIVAVKAPSGAGRKTLLDLMAGTLYPTKGNVFIPSHLRSILISREIHILDLSMWANLTFGNKHGNNPYRVEKILQHFNLDKVLKDSDFQKDLNNRKIEFDGTAVGNATGHITVDADDEKKEEEGKTSKKNPMLKFREAEQALIHLIRGFIMNPEVMLLHRPFVHFHSRTIADAVHTALLESRDNRGFHMPRETLLSRRPRTLFMSFDAKQSDISMADFVWELPRELGSECKQYAPTKAPETLHEESPTNRERQKPASTTNGARVPFGTAERSLLDEMPLTTSATTPSLGPVQTNTLVSMFEAQIEQSPSPPGSLTNGPFQLTPIPQSDQHPQTSQMAQMAPPPMNYCTGFNGHLHATPQFGNNAINGAYGINPVNVQAIPPPKSYGVDKWEV